MSKLVHVDLENFTVFSRLSLDLSPGVNVIIGANATGKTHLLKVLYAACAITARADKEKTFSQKLRGVFQPFQGKLGRLVKRQSEGGTALIRITRESGGPLSLKFSSRAKAAESSKGVGEAEWKQTESLCTYVPVKETLANAPGFLSTMAMRAMAFDETYEDILYRAFYPPLKGEMDADRKRIVDELQRTIGGIVVQKQEYFFLKNSLGELEFTLVAEGIRKLALIWVLIQNGILLEGSVLFWDEPEANINPNLMGVVVDIMLELQRMGVQIVLATHNYVILKEFDLRKTASDAIKYISLFRNDQGEIQADTNDEYRRLDHNAIADTFSDLYNRDIERALGSDS